MNFLFVDRILDFVPGKSITGIKHVTLSDTYFTQTQGKFALLHSIIGEALGQLCSWYVLKSTDFQLRLVGGVIEEIQMIGDAHVGDTIFLENEIPELNCEDRFVRVNARASVKGKPILLFKNGIAPLLPLEEFNDPEDSKKDFARLYRPEAHFDHSSDPEKFDYPLDNPTPELAPFIYDKILSWKPGHELIAQKNISMTAPYFADHFPRKPLYPLSIMIEHNLHLSYAFFGKEMSKTIPLKKCLRPIAVRKIKIGNFVQPGDSVVTRISLKEQKVDGFILSFHNTVDNKKVCVAEAEFGMR
jgi:3-hydroxymyristoyl/3-hydroxydecanoyl-(acyl carrier protein) dehydratase